MNIVLTKDETSKLESLIDTELLNAGVDHAIVVDTSGNLVMERGSEKLQDVLSLAVLAAANFAATAEIAKLLGEEDFSLLFHKGDKRNIHFSRLSNTYLMITLFGEHISLGLIRLKSNSVVEKFLSICNRQGG